jgi:hypothetical protein
MEKRKAHANTAAMCSRAGEVWQIAPVSGYCGLENDLSTVAYSLALQSLTRYTDYQTRAARAMNSAGCIYL